MTLSAPAFEDLRQGDFVKVRCGNERMWFEVLAHVKTTGVLNAVICIPASQPEEAVFDGRSTIDREWIIETQRRTKPTFHVVHASKSDCN